MKMKSKALVAVIVLVAMLAGCSSAGDGDDPSGAPTTILETLEPKVSLHVPETAVAGTMTDLVIDSSGHDGETANLYTFRAPYDEVSDCTDTTAQTTPINLIGGPQKITVNAGGQGDTWFVLSGDRFSTECAAEGSRLRALMTYEPRLRVCDGGVICPDLGEAEARKVGEGFTYGVSMKSEVQPLTSSLVTVVWVGPFSTVPDAKSNPCLIDPIVGEDNGEMVWEAGWSQMTFDRTFERPGVYRAILTLDATDYAAGYEMSCESAPLITVR